VADEIPRLTTSMGDGAAVIAPTLSLRPVDTGDEALLLRIFAESHCAGFELLGLDPVALAGLIRMQYQARESQYRTNPDAVEYLICLGSGQDGVPVGSCRLATTAEQLRVLDIAVLVEHRRRGVARAVLTGLCAQATAAGKPVRLSVWHQNHPARELYRALGFVPDLTVGGSEGSEPGDLGNGYLELLYSDERHLHDFYGDATESAAQYRAVAR
jgi:ribosomal protein S18 acetylase RimI-like enzyme